MLGMGSVPSNNSIISRIWIALSSTTFLSQVSVKHIMSSCSIQQEYSQWSWTKENSLNRIEAVNFNKYGKQESIGFTSCSEKFVDNFLHYVYVYVPDYFVTAKKTYTEVGHVNKHIRDMLNQYVYDLRKCKVKVITPKGTANSRMVTLKSKEAEKTLYYIQEFKIT